MKTLLCILRKNFMLVATLLLLLLLLLSVGVNIRFLFSSRAAEVGSTTSVSSTNSYVFLSPLTAEANNTDRIRVNVFLLNERGIGVAAQTVALQTSSQVTTEAIQSISDNYGRAVFDIYTPTPGNYSVSVQVNGRAIGETTTATFK